MRLRVKRLHPHARLPCYGRPGDAGLDLFAIEDISIPAKERRAIGTGVAIALPERTVGLIWDRSGLAYKQGIKTMAGVVDYTYRGECKVILLNTSDEAYEVRKGDRIAQILVQPIHEVHIEEETELDLTIRNEEGFGSSGR